MYIKNIVKTTLVCRAIAIFFAVFFLTSCSMRSLTGLFFGVNTAPIQMPIKSQLEMKEADEKTIAIVGAAKAFISSLDDNQRQVVAYDFYDNAQRSNWSNFPEGMIPRGGLKLGALSTKQRLLLDQLLAEIMSEKGALNVTYQLAAEDTFAPSAMLKYGTQYYYVAFLGEPSNTYPWMFQFGGHHLAINATVYGPDVTFSPMLTGGQPLYIQYGEEDIFIVQEELLAAQTFLDNLTEEQKELAVRGEKPIDLLLGPGEYGTAIEPEGIRAGELTKVQRQLLVAVIDARLSFINSDDRTAAMATILADLDDTYFAWWGPQEPLGFAYFRVTAPSLVLEYSPQYDDGEETIDHAHSIYRNPKNDYGGAWLND